MRLFQNVSTCKYVCMKFNKTILNLINDLRSFIIIEIFLNKILKIYFIDKKYHTFNFRSNEFQKSRFQSQRFYKFEIQDKTTKQCFASEKENPWSIKHFKNKQNAIKKRFQNKYKERIDKRIEKQTNQYIFDYKRVDLELINNDQNEINETNHDMKTLIVDVAKFDSFDITFNDKTFITLFKVIKDVKSILYNLID